MEAAAVESNMLDSSQQLSKLEGLVGNLFELHVALRDEHKALCDCLFSADVLSHGDLRKAIKARQMSSKVKNVMETPRLAHALGMWAGVAAADRLGAAGHVGARVKKSLSPAEREALLAARCPTPRIGPPLQEILRKPKLALELGCILGLTMTRRLSRTSRAYGEGMRTALPRVAARLPPDIYAVGGYDAGKACVDIVERFDINTGGWQILPPMPSARVACAAARVDGMLYVVGGHRGLLGERCLPTCERFDPTTNTWTALASMSTARRACSAAGHSGQLYVVGAEGEDLSGPITGERFSPLTGTWEAMPALPLRDCRQCQLVGAEQLYLVASVVSGHDCGVQCMDASGKWNALPVKPVSEDDYSFSTAAACAEALYVLGKIANSPVCERFDFATLQWDRLDFKNWDVRGVPRSLSVVSGRLFILSDCWRTNADNFEAEGVFVNLSTGRAQPWLPPMPTARIECALLAAWR